MWRTERGELVVIAREGVRYAADGGPRRGVLAQHSDEVRARGPHVQEHRELELLHVSPDTHWVHKAAGDLWHQPTVFHED